MKVTLICHEPIAVDPRNRQSWSDVWVRYRQGREWKRFGPTLVGRADVEADLEIHEEIRAEDPKKRAKWYASDDKEMTRVMSAFSEGQKIVVGRNWKNGTPTLYINKDYFNRRDAERMIAAMLEHLKVSDYYFYWRPIKNGLVVIPAAIPPKRLRKSS